VIPFHSFDGIPAAQFNWREELYRQALLAFGSSTRGSYYDEELMAEWRLLYNPLSNDDSADSFKHRWESHFGPTYNTNGSLTGNPPWMGYNPDILLAPNKIRYWLDIIDASTGLGRFSVDRIGRRTYVNDNNKVNQVFKEVINDIVFIESNNDAKINYYNSIG